ncbi:SDR family oxidoreductase [Nocardia panacis]|uniref:SDR family oxidoreductase n=1 Tax=Nocardia panacis TaxID=2340916 RepID=A0A3A4KF86_9NOCA|nr:SDR family oxidoreductase [Nocardia panacis]RJO71996.1 SDR family oxidoreductase [Nocardia panacis]
MTAIDYHGRTTLITGASAGIGTQFARQLAARGSDLVLVARRAERLKSLAAELETTHGVTAHPLPFDLSEPDVGPELAAAVATRGLHVTGVINNAGFGTFGPFHAEDPTRLRQEIALDITAVVDISHAFLPQLRAAETGVLVNVASMAAYQPTPRMAVYGASKAFVLSFTEALWAESRGTGLRVLAVSPGATETEFFDVAGTRAAAGGTRTASPAQVVAAALAALDRRNPPPSVVSGRGNRITVALSRRLTTRRQMLTVMDRMTRPNT